MNYLRFLRLPSEDFVDVMVQLRYLEYMERLASVLFNSLFLLYIYIYIYPSLLKSIWRMLKRDFDSLSFVDNS